MVDFDHVPPEKMTEAVIRTKNDKHTKLCYVTISGAGMRVIASVEGEVTNLNYNDIMPKLFKICFRNTNV